MSRTVKKLARRFLRTCDRGVPTAADVKNALTQQGYTLVTFNAAYNDPPTEAVIRGLCLQDYIRSSKGFTYADSTYRLVFLHEDLSEQEQLLVLLHELGHILCHHFGKVTIAGQDVLQEHEANEFVHCALHPAPFFRLGRWLRRHQKPLIAAAAALAAVGIAAGIFAAVISHRRSTQTFYVTSTGSKYHDRDCIFTKNKDDVTAMSLEELEAEGYTPCDVCHPNR